MTRHGRSWRSSSVDKRFPGVHALKDVVDRASGRSEVVGLIGENGAGKSTLMKILAGVYQPDAGQILLAGKPTVLRSAADANRKGIGMVFQEQSLLTNLTVGENIYLGNEAQFTRFGIVDWRALYAAARRGSSPRSALDIDPRMRADDLDFASRQMVELAKALTLEEQRHGPPRDPARRADLGARAGRDRHPVRARPGAARRAPPSSSSRTGSTRCWSSRDRIYVMKDGAVVAELPAAEADVPHAAPADGRARPAGRILPRAAADALPATRSSSRRRASRSGAYRDVDFKLHAGRDPGHRRRDRLRPRGADPHARRLRAARRRHAHGRRPAAVRFTTPAEAVDLGIGYIPRERRVEGLVLFLPVAANITLASLGEPDAATA